MISRGARGTEGNAQVADALAVSSTSVRKRAAMRQPGRFGRTEVSWTKLVFRKLERTTRPHHPSPDGVTLAGEDSASLSMEGSVVA